MPRMAMPRMARSLLLIGLWCLTSQARAELKPAHITLRDSRAQEKREQTFRYLMHDKKPSFLQNRSEGEFNRWGRQIREQIYNDGRQMVRRIVANPTSSPTLEERKIIGLLSPKQRAQLLKEEAGFKVTKADYKVNGRRTEKLKIHLKRFSTNEYNWGSDSPEFRRQMKIYNRVMSPNTITYAPAGGHSKYVSQGHVTDIYFNSNYGELRPNRKPLFPTWLSDDEAQRMKVLADTANTNWNTSMGTKMSHGRPGMWPPTRGQRAETGNSCTTVFIRGPVGEREASHAWIDKLQDKVQSAAKSGRLRVQGVNLRQDRLLEAITGKSPRQYASVFEALKRQLPDQARQLNKLQGEVDFFYGKLKAGNRRYDYNTHQYVEETPTCHFPMDMMHRTPLSKLANIKGDPVGPGMAKQKFYGGDPTRLGVVTVFDGR